MKGDWVELALGYGAYIIIICLIHCVSFLVRCSFFHFSHGKPLIVPKNNNLFISYDIRFPEYALLLTQTHQCKILIYPGAFNLTTGPAHWELLQRARAVDGQCYVLTASPARMPPPDKDAGDDESKYPHYSAWGHSTVISPWGEVVATCEEKPAVVLADLDMKKVEEMRMAIPTMVQKRHDLYRLVGGD